ncbi:MAG: hypothetical protein HOO96_25085 [Polyangiaceae bacterium]|nr:hypothetical protein [Polyangiaceae bacterium]
MPRIDQDTQTVSFKVIFCSPRAALLVANFKKVAAEQGFAEFPAGLPHQDLTFSLGEVRGMKTDFILHPAPEDPAARAALLSGVDVVVLIADKTPSEIAGCLAYAKDLCEALRAQRIEVPVVVQMHGNPELPDRPILEHLNFERITTVAADAKTGDGIMETVKAAAKAGLLAAKG